MPHNHHINNILKYGLYILTFLPFFIFRDFTPGNELRYLSIADEALRNGSVFTFTNHGIPYADKPPLYLWIVMLGKLIFGTHNLLFLGLFSFLPALVILYVMDKWVKNVLTESERLIAQLLLLTSCFFIGTAVVLRMDMLMCMFIVLALYTFFKVYSGEGKPRDSILFTLFVFMALFSKGPIGIIVPFVSIVTFLLLKKDIQSIGKYWGWKTLLILAALSGAWFAGVYAEGGRQYLDNLLFNQTVNRAVNSFHHQEPFYYYFLTIWYALAPWSFLVIGILWVGIKNKMASTDLELFFLTVGLSTFVILSLFSSKLAVYLLPAFPFFIYLSLLWFKRLGSPRWMYVLVSIPACLLCLALPGIFLTPYFINFSGLSSSFVVLFAALILSASGILTLRYLLKHQLNVGILIMSNGILLSIFTVSFAIPHFNNYIGLRGICDQAKNESKKNEFTSFYFVGMFRAENLDVYLDAVPERIRTTELYRADSPVKVPAIIFTRQKAILRNDTLKAFVETHHPVRLGNYYYFKIDK